MVAIQCIATRKDRDYDAQISFCSGRGHLSACLLCDGSTISHSKTGSSGSHSGARVTYQGDSTYCSPDCCPCSYKGSCGRCPNSRAESGGYASGASQSR